MDNEAFIAAYIQAALWSSRDDRTDREAYLDGSFSAGDLAPEAMEKIRADCLRFIEAHGSLINDDNLMRRDYPAAERAGHDFWLTRNGHGCGFWDGCWAPEAGRMLTDGAKAFGEAGLYAGDDGRVYAE